VEAILGTLGLNLPAFLWHSANFLLLLFLLWRVLYKPVTGMLDERARRVRESLERAEEVRRQAEQAEADRKTLLAETRREAEQIRARAEEQAKRILAEAKAQQEEQAARTIASARAEIEASRKQMEADLRAQIADLVVVAVDRVTRRALDTQAHRTLIQQFLTTDTGNGAGPVPKG
jgi:F-type H+-transporting ATPase subunit b